MKKKFYKEPLSEIFEISYEGPLCTLSEISLINLLEDMESGGDG